MILQIKSQTILALSLLLSLLPKYTYTTTLEYSIYLSTLDTIARNFSTLVYYFQDKSIEISSQYHNSHWFAYCLVSELGKSRLIRMSKFKVLLSIYQIVHSDNHRTNHFHLHQHHCYHNSYYYSVIFYPKPLLLPACFE